MHYQMQQQMMQQSSGGGYPQHMQQLYPPVNTPLTPRIHPVNTQYTTRHTP